MKSTTKTPRINWARGKKFSRCEMPKLGGLVSNRVYLLLSRFYLWGYIQKPLEQVTDEEFMAIPGMGPKTLKEVRKVLPGPIEEVIAMK